MKRAESVAGILFNKEKTSVLLIQRLDVPVWVLPGGGIEPTETPEQAIEREILEETGFQVKVRRLIGDYDPINRLAKKTLLFEVDLQGGKASLSKETKGISFFDVSSLPPMPPPYKEWIEQGIEEKPPVKKKLTSVNYKTLFLYLLTHPVLLTRFLLARLGFPINR